MAERLWHGWSGRRAVRLLDAGCGHATLLTAAVRAGVSRGARVHAHGIDRDASAVRRATALADRMRAAAGASLLSWTIQRDDYLLVSEEPRRYDRIIANPPYVSLGSLPAEERRRLQSRHGTGRGDLAMLFLDAMLCQLAPGGRLVALVPNKLLAAHYARHLRQRLLTAFQLREVHDLSSLRTFPGVGAYPVILVVERSDRRGRVRIVGDAEETRGQLEPGQIAELPGSLLPLRLAPELIGLVHRLRRQGTFAEAVRVSCGIAVPGFGRAVGHGTETIVLSGDVQPFRVRRRRPFDPDRAGLVPARLERQRVDKIVLPGMFQELCAARSGPGDLLGRVYFIPVRDGTDSGGRAHAALLLALLNSRLLRVLYRGLFGAVAQAGGWLRLNGPYLDALPWPQAPPSRRLVACVEAAERSGAPDPRLDALVEDLYGLSPEEICCLEQASCIAPRPVRTVGTRTSRRAASGALGTIGSKE